MGGTGSDNIYMKNLNVKSRSIKTSWRNDDGADEGALARIVLSV
jgi:hypothetical protein